MPLSPYQLGQLGSALDYITDVLIALSLFGCVGTIATFLLFSEMRTYPIKLILYLCMSIFFAQLFFWLSFELYESIMCIPCAMILHYFFLASFFWTFCVAFNFYQMIVRRNRDAESLEKIYHLVSWLVPLVVVVIVVSFKSYAANKGYCYIYGQVPIFLSFFLPGLIIVSSNGVIFFFIAREIHETLSSAPTADKKEKSKEYRVYFSIFVSLGLSWFIGFLLPFLPDNSDTEIIFLVLFSVLSPPQGFLIFLSYCVNMKVLSKWAGLVGIVIPWFKRYENMGSGSATSTTSGGSTNSHRNSANSSSPRDSSRGNSVELTTTSTGYSNTSSADMS